MTCDELKLEEIYGTETPAATRQSNCDSHALSCSQLHSAALSKEAIESSENCVFLANHCGAVVYWCTHSPFLASVVGVGGW